MIVKSLIDLDYQFLSTSEKFSNQQIQQRLKAEKKALRI